MTSSNEQYVQKVVEEPKIAGENGNVPAWALIDGHSRQERSNVWMAERMTRQA
jgi:hypothetical protein